MSQNNYKKLLIMTVGGSPDQIRKSIEYWKPKRILFICSPKSKQDFESKVDLKTNFGLRKDEIDFIVLDEYQNIQKNIEQIKDRAEIEHKK